MKEASSRYGLIGFEIAIMLLWDKRNKLMQSENIENNKFLSSLISEFDLFAKENFTSLDDAIKALRKQAGII